ncbi:hypothetical protein [Paraburkholderia sp. BCC1876]|uniref:hypothetical protein n=1 Tax=Paraburkholderia sp. BCC1876 TaxID=2676303 RepID=UPI0015908F9C|nr:hypothetical protein [Paraburkholderia sp. BCC1876]
MLLACASSSRNEMSAAWRKTLEDFFHERLEVSRSLARSRLRCYLHEVEFGQQVTVDAISQIVDNETRVTHDEMQHERMRMNRRKIVLRGALPQA